MYCVALYDTGDYETEVNEGEGPPDIQSVKECFMSGRVQFWVEGK